MIAFAYYGAKNRLLNQLLQYLPACDHYSEPFCGSAAVILNRPAAPIESINDINGDIVNFFKVLRDRPDCLVSKLLLTPYAYEEFRQAWLPIEDEIERARRFYIRTQMDVAKACALKDKSWSVNKKFVAGGHSYCVKNFHHKIPGLMDVANRLKNVQIDNRSAIDHIKKFDTKETLFYCDPPYLPDTRKSANDYKFEMDVDDHYQLAVVLNGIKGRAAISGYDSPLMGEFYQGWIKVKFKSAQVPMSRGSGLVRQECLWLNYKPSIQTELFS